MNVWIVNPFDNLPVEGYRPQRYWLMSEALARAGHRVTYGTQNWSHAQKDERRLTGGRTLEELKRIWSHWRFAKNWAALVSAATEAPDLIVVSSPPLFIGREVRRFCARTGAKYIVDIMDAWPETFERVAPRWTLGWMRRLARTVIYRPHEEQIKYSLRTRATASRLLQPLQTMYRPSRKPLPSGALFAFINSDFRFIAIDQFSPALSYRTMV